MLYSGQLTSVHDGYHSYLQTLLWVSSVNNSQNLQWSSVQWYYIYKSLNDHALTVLNLISQYNPVLSRSSGDETFPLLSLATFLLHPLFFALTYLTACTGFASSNA